MSTKLERSQAASILGEQGRKLRWKKASKRERMEFAKKLAAARWPSFAKALAMDAERRNDMKEGTV